MDRIEKQFIELNNFDESSVDCTRTPSSAEEYLRQVVAGRSRIPDYIAHNVPDKYQTQTPSKPIETMKPIDPRAAKPTWIESKSQDFERKRESLKTAPHPSLKINTPNMTNQTEWHRFIIEQCAPELKNVRDKFPNQTGTPPALPLIQQLSQPKVNSLIEFIAEWAEEEGFSRPLREWLYALMLVVDLPLLHDVTSSLRSIAKMCRQLRSSIPLENEEDIAEMSLFITVISQFFGQKDLSDL